MRAPAPTGHVKMYNFPRLDNNKRQLGNTTPDKTPDASVVYNAQWTLRVNYLVLLELENKPLLHGHVSDRNLIYEFTLRTTTGTRIVRYWLSHTDSCNIVEQFYDVDWTKDVIIDAKIYWTNPH